MIRNKGLVAKLGRDQWGQRPCPFGAQLSVDQGCLGGLCSRGLTAWNGGDFADAFDVYLSRALAAGTGLRPRTECAGIDFGQRLDSFGHSGLRR